MAAYRTATQAADSWARKAYRAGPRLSSWCRTIAEQFRRVLRYDLMQQWLQRILATRDKQVAMIEAYLKRPRPQVVRAAIAALGKSGDRRLVSRLGQRLLKEDSLDTRFTLIQALAELGFPGAADYALQRLRGSEQRLPPEEERRLYALLGRVGGAPAEQYLLQRYSRIGVERKDNPSIRSMLEKSILLALTACGGKPALDFLQDCLGNDSALAQYRKVIAEGLGSMRRANPGELLRRLDALGEQDLSAQVAKAFAQAGATGQEQYLLDKLARYRKAGKDYSRLVKALVKAPFPRTRNALLGLLSDPRLDFNSAALLVPVIERHQPQEAVPLLLARAKKEKDLNLLSLMLDMLGKLKAKPAVPLLERYLKHGAPGVRLVAASALQTITGKRYQVDALP